MRKLTFTFVLLSLTFGLQAQTTLATFEDANTDFFNTCEWEDATAGAASIENNPDAGGLNTSLKSLKNLRNTGCSWTNNLKLHNAAGESLNIDAQNKFLHIYVYATEAAQGRIQFSSNSTEGVWDHENQNAQFDFAAGIWKDIVIDLQSTGFQTLNAIFFMSQDWSGASADRHFYYDEIVLNGDATPRAIMINSATTLADFEDAGIAPLYSNSGNAFLSLDVDNNPAPSSLNSTDKVLSAVTTTSGGEWWGGLKINLGDKVLNVNEDTRYLHFLIYTDLPTIEFVSGSDWAGAYTVTQQEEWFDFVVDLFNVKDKSLENTQIAVLDIIINTSEANCQGKTFLIDEIIVNADENPRTADETGIKTTDASDIVGVKYYTLQGIEVSGIETEGIYLVTKRYKSGETATGKILVKANK
jgi:hypothetical protein